MEMTVKIGVSPDWAGGKTSIIVTPDFSGPEFLTPTQARKFAVRLLELAAQVDSPSNASEWP